MFSLFEMFLAIFALNKNGIWMKTSFSKGFIKLKLLTSFTCNSDCQSNKLGPSLSRQLNCYTLAANFFNISWFCCDHLPLFANIPSFDSLDWSLTWWGQLPHTRFEELVAAAVFEPAHDVFFIVLLCMPSLTLTT